MSTTPSFNKFLAKVEKMRKEGGVDLSAAEDLSMAVMNLVSLEEHFFFTAEKTAKPEYHDLAATVREERKALLAKLMPNHEGETWCASKHLLAAAMRLIEVGNKYQSEGKKEEAGGFFKQAYRIYALFWGLRLKLFNLSSLKKDAAAKKSWSVDDLVEKLANCCDE